MTRVLIASNCELIAEGVQRVVERETGMKVVGEAANAELTFELLKAEKCDLLVLDVDLGAAEGFVVLDQVKAMSPDLRVLLLGNTHEGSDSVRALKLGASGYLSKSNLKIDELHGALRTVAKGRNYVSISGIDYLARNAKGEMPDRPHDILSNREFQVFRGIAQGKSTGEISNELRLCKTTVSTYKRNIFTKMGFENEAQIVRYAIENKL